MWYDIIHSIRGQQRSIIWQALGAHVLFIFIVLVILDHQNATITTGIVLAMAGSLITAGVFFGVLWFIPSAALDHAREVYGEDALQGPDKVKVDPWDYQARLMSISGQFMADKPTFTRGTLLYIALMLEEMSETCVAAADILASPPSVGDTGTAVLGWPLLEASRNLQHNSMKIRELLKTHAFDIELTPAEAYELLDGITDVMVVAAGASLAAGLPGKAAYVEVATSNLSKANPDTGVIDKDPSGKWIKGRNYKAPDLISVLAAARRPTNPAGQDPRD